MALMERPSSFEKDFTSTNDVISFEEGSDPEKENLELFGVSAYVRERFNRSKTHRMADEDRWLQAYRNFRGLYGADQPTTDTEKSKAFIKVTKTKVAAGYAQITDVLFAGSVFPIGIEASPVPTGSPETVHFDPKAVPGKDSGSATVARPEILKMVGPLKKSLERVKDELQEGPGLTPTALTFSPAQEAAKKMQKKIHDQLYESDASKHLRSSIFELCLFGSLVHKGPFAIDKEYPRWKSDGDGKGTYSPIFETIPQVSHTSIWNSYPDPEARNIDEAEYFIERHRLSRTQLRALKKRPHFRKESIENVILDGPNYVEEYWESALEDNAASVEQNRFEVLEYWGMMDRDTAEEADLDIPSEMDDLDEFQVNVWISGSQILRLVLNPFTPARIPYYCVPYEHNPYSFFGIGIAENMADTQLLMNGFMRLAIDNAALSSNLIFEIDENSIVAGQDMKVYPGKIFRRQAGAPGQGLFSTKFQNISNECFMMFDKARQLADESTGIQSYSHGGTGVPGVGRTAAGMSMLMGASAQNIKSVVRNIDDYLLAPLGRAMFAFNMQFNYDEDMTEGDLSVVARGTESLMRNEVRSQKILQFLQVGAGNPLTAPYMKIDELMREFASSIDLDETRFVNDNREAAIQAKLMQAMAPPPQPGSGPAPGGNPTGAPPVSDPTGNGGGNIAPGAAPVPGAAGYTGAGGGANGGNPVPAQM